MLYTTPVIHQVMQSTLDLVCLIAVLWLGVANYLMIPITVIFKLAVLSESGQEHIELPEAAREHVTSHIHCIDGEIQTGWMYSKYSSFRIRIFYGETGNI